MPNVPLLDLTPSYPLKEYEEWRVLTSESESGREYRTNRWSYPRREWDVIWKNFPKQQGEGIRNLITRLKGSGSFFWKEPHPTSRTRVYVGTGDGTRRTWIMPAIDYQALRVYVNGVTVTPATYEIVQGLAQNGLDLIVLTAAPASGQAVHIDYCYGYLVPLVRVANLYESALVPPGWQYQEIRLTLREDKNRDQVTEIDAALLCYLPLIGDTSAVLLQAEKITGAVSFTRATAGASYKGQAIREDYSSGGALFEAASGEARALPAESHGGQAYTPYTAWDGSVAKAMGIYDPYGMWRHGTDGDIEVDAYMNGWGSNRSWDVTDFSEGTQATYQGVYANDIHQFRKGDRTCYSVFLKEKGRPYIAFWVTCQGTTVGVDVDLGTGEIYADIGTPGDVKTKGILNVGNGWYRVWFSFDHPIPGAGSGSNGEYHVYGEPIYLQGRQTRGGTTIYSGDPTKGFYVMGVARYGGADKPAWFAYAPSNFTSQQQGGILIEAQRTNVCLRSGDFANASWTLTGLKAFGAGSTSNAYVDPFQNQETDELVEDTSTGTHRVHQTVVLAANADTVISVYLFYNGVTGRNVRLYLGDGTNFYYADFNADNGGRVQATGAGGNGLVFDAGCEPLQTAYGFFLRVWVRGKHSTTIANPQFRIYLTDATYQTSYTGTGTGSLRLWGGQVEVGLLLSSIIRTTSAAVTRNADVLTIQAASNIYQSRGTAYLKATIPRASIYCVSSASPSASAGVLASDAGEMMSLQSQRRFMGRWDGTYSSPIMALPNSGYALCQGSMPFLTKWGYGPTCEMMARSAVGSEHTAGVFAGLWDPSPTNIYLGSIGGGASTVLYGAVKHVAIWDGAISYDRMQRMAKGGRWT